MAPFCRTETTKKDRLIAENRATLGVCLVGKCVQGSYRPVFSGFVVETGDLFPQWKRKCCLVTSGTIDLKERYAYFKKLPVKKSTQKKVKLDVSSSKDPVHISPMATGLAFIPLKKELKYYRKFLVNKRCTKESINGSVCHIVEGNTDSFTVTPYNLKYVNEEYVLELPENGTSFKTLSELTASGSFNLHPKGAVILKKNSLMAVGALGFVDDKIQPVLFSQFLQEDLGRQPRPDTNPTVNTDGTAPSVPTDGATSSVTTDGTTSSVPTNRTTPSVTTDGTAPSVPTDGATPSVTTDGATSSVPTDGTTPSVTTDGATSSVPTDGTTSSVPTDGTTSSMPTNGTTPSVTTDGTAPSVPTDGATSPVPTDGTAPLVTTDGTTSSVHTDGTTPSVPIDGATSPVPTDGTAPLVTTDGATSSVPTDGTAPSVSTVGTTPSVTTDGTARLAITDGTGSSVTTNGTAPSATTNGTTPLVTTVGTAQSATTDGTTPSVTADGAAKHSYLENLESSGLRTLGKVSKEELTTWESLGEGGFASTCIYKAKLKGIDVAGKVFKNPKETKSLQLKEGNFLRDLRFDNIVAFRGMNILKCDMPFENIFTHEKFTLEAGSPFLVMEYIPKYLPRFVEDHKTPESQALPKSQVWTIGRGMANRLIYLDLNILSSEGFFRTRVRPQGLPPECLVCEVKVGHEEYNSVPKEWVYEQNYHEYYRHFKQDVIDKMIEDAPTTGLKSLITACEGEERHEIKLVFGMSTYCHHRAVSEIWRRLKDSKKWEFLRKNTVHPVFSTSFGLHVALLTADSPQKFIFSRRTDREGMANPGKFTCGAVESTSIKDYIHKDGKAFVNLIQTAARGLEEQLRVELKGSDIEAICLSTVYLKLDTHECGCCGYVDLSDERVAPERRLTFEQLGSRLMTGPKDKFAHGEVVAVDFELPRMVKFIRENDEDFASSAKMVVVKVLQLFFGVAAVERAFCVDMKDSSLRAGSLLGFK